MVNLINGDCLEELKKLEENSIDSIVTDPPYELGFLGKKWDNTGIAYSVELWSECLRVLKPGAHLLAFGGTRTYHRMTCAIEDAGFDIRDCISWIYGSGMPKSHNLKGNHEGWGTALKPANEPIVLARKPLKGNVATNVASWGTGALHIDACRIDLGSEYDPNHIQRQKASGTANVKGAFGAERLVGKEIPTYNEKGRWPANVIIDGSSEVLSNLPESPGKSGENSSTARFFYCAKASKQDRDEGMEGFEEKRTGALQGTVDSSLLTGSGNIRNTMRKNTHPTVKPTQLMQYLCRLVTPENGIVLDPFMGSGSTGKGAVLEGFNFIGIELETEYCDIAKARIISCTNEAD